MSNNTTDSPQLDLIAGVRYDNRFLEAHAGNRVLSDPKTAVVELIANAWDAGATEVTIDWPDGHGIRRFSITDNGCGMTADEFNARWRTLNYNRRSNQGGAIEWPPSLAKSPPTRYAFGRNGIGRWSGFCFGDSYVVRTHKQGASNVFRVTRGTDVPFEISHLKENEPADSHGTMISSESDFDTPISAEDARAEIGMRYLTDPNFIVRVNGEPVSFEHIDDPNIQKTKLSLPSGHDIELIAIDTQATARTSKQHGVAWHVGGRLVGTCSWRGIGTDDLIDGRKIAAKRFTFIVRADHLAEADAVKQDWSGFDMENEAFRESANAVYQQVRDRLLAISEDDRKETLAKATTKNKDKLASLGPRGREQWNNFITAAQEKCPSITERDMLRLSEIVANLEQAQSGYALLNQLSKYGPDELDDLNKLLEDWSLDMAKVALDEISQRLKLIEELQIRMNDPSTDEVQELQPLFKQGLWIFGPEFETIEYTSNQGMTRVVQDLFKAILPDGTCGLYAYPRYDEEGGEIGTDRLVVVELKKPGVKIGDEQKGQCWRYVKELYERGMLVSKVATVRCFVLGSSIDDLEASRRSEMEDTVWITPLLFDTVLQRAKSRLLKLHQRVQDAPFLQQHRDEIEKFLADVEVFEGDTVLFENTG